MCISTHTKKQAAQNLADIKNRVLLRKYDWEKMDQS